MTTKLSFDIQRVPRRCGVVSATKYWIGLELPTELCSLSMRQLTALRKMVTKAFNEGRKEK